MIIATEQVPHEKGTPPDHSAAHEIHADFHLLPTRQKRNAVPGPIEAQRVARDAI